MDRENRDRLAEALSHFAWREMTDSEFDDQITKIRKATRDKTIRHIVDDAEGYVIHPSDSTFTFDKPSWDHFQRLILVLQSDAQIVTEKNRFMHLRQWIAIVSLIAMYLLLKKYGAGFYFGGITILFGLPLFAMCLWSEKNKKRHHTARLKCEPFASREEIAKVRRQTSTFTKQPWPRPVAEKTFEIPGMMTGLIWLQTFIFCTALTPIFMLIMAFPESHSISHVQYQ